MKATEQTPEHAYAARQAPPTAPHCGSQSPMLGKPGSSLIPFWAPPQHGEGRGVVVPAARHTLCWV